jgi:hypothetical protein
MLSPYFLLSESQFQEAQHILFRSISSEIIHPFVPIENDVARAVVPQTGDSRMLVAVQRNVLRTLSSFESLRIWYRSSLSQ